ncbi:unnamed protein product, partial [marine sediment metagenome]
DDYIGYVLGQLIVDPEQLPVSAIPLPGKPTHLGIWVADPLPERTVVDILEYINIRTKIQSSEGEISIIDLELIPTELIIDGESPYLLEPENEPTDWYQFLSIVFNEISPTSDESVGLISQEPPWRYFEAQIPDFAEQGYPLSLHSMWIKIRRFPTESGSYLTSQGPLIIDDLSIRDSDQKLNVFEGFEELATIWQTDSKLSLASYSKHDITHSGEASMRLFLGSPSSSNWMVMSPAQLRDLISFPSLPAQ